ncbi:MAG: TerD family protein [archaeon]|nr:TerD family protein [archaeon]
MYDIDTMNIKFTFLSGQDLLSADWNGKSDPYALIPKGQRGILNFPSKKGFKTHHKNNTLNPIWNQSFDIRLNPNECSLIRIEVYDYDVIGSDDFLGSNNYSFEFLGGIDKTKYFCKEETLPLSIMKKDKKTKKESLEMHGSIKIKIEYLPPQPVYTMNQSSYQNMNQPMQPLRSGYPNQSYNQGYPNTMNQPIQQQRTGYTGGGYNSVLPNQMGGMMQSQMGGSVMMNYPNALQPGTWLPIQEPEVFVGLGWDFTGGNTFDLDASITPFDDGNNVVEKPIYFSNKRGLGGSIIHHGDNLTGEGEGDDEVITVKLSQIPKVVTALAVTVNSYKGQSLIGAKSGFIRVYTRGRELGKYILARTKDCVGLLLGLFERNMNNGEWFFTVMADPIEGRVVVNSIPSLKELLGNYNNAFTSVNCPKPTHPFPNEILFNPGNWVEVKCANTFVGLGWDIVRGYTYDLDAGIIIFDGGDNVLDVIYHKNMRSLDGSIYHMGDNKTGAGEGDDEIMGINFGSIAPNIMTLAVILNSFKGNTLTGVQTGFIRIFDNNGPIGCHLIGKGKDSTGLLLGLFRRDMSGKWLFQAMIEPISGVIAPESVNDVKCLLYNYRLAEQIQKEKEEKERIEREKAMEEEKRKMEEAKQNSVTDLPPQSVVEGIQQTDSVGQPIVTNDYPTLEGAPPNNGNIPQQPPMENQNTFPTQPEMPSMPVDNSNTSEQP